MKKAVIPSMVLRQGAKRVVSVEMTNGDVWNGVLSKSDLAMNLHLRDCIRTSPDGGHFFKAREVLLRGAQVKTVRLDPASLIPVKAERGVRRSTQDKDGPRVAKQARTEGAEGSTRGRGHGGQDRGRRVNNGDERGRGGGGDNIDNRPRVQQDDSRGRGRGGDRRGRGGDRGRGSAEFRGRGGSEGRGRGRGRGRGEGRGRGRGNDGRGRRQAQT